MHPIAKHVGKLYCNFKVQKEHIVNKAPPEIPIVSAWGSITENIGKFVQHHLDPLAKEHKSYIEDTPDLLRQIEDLNKGEILLPNSNLFTCDVIGLFTNITQEDGIEAATEALEERKIKEVPTQFITRLLELVLQYNIFEHDSTLYRQQIGTSMGSKPAPDFSNIFMARRIDNEIRKIARKYTKGNVSLKLFKRFLDDILAIFIGSTKSLHKFIQEINKIHPAIKLTMSHTSIPGEAKDSRCSCQEKQSIPYLDTSLSIKHGKISVDLYKNLQTDTKTCYQAHATQTKPHKTLHSP